MAAATTCSARPSLLAATAVKDWLAENGIKARVRYYGCPAEEGGAAKGFMVRAGAFDDVDIAICWHPAAFTGVNEARLARQYAHRLHLHRPGLARRRGAAISAARALDAVELMNVGVNYMREHMPSDARIHYAYLDAGGIAPNVVQGAAKVRYLIRARDLVGLNQLVARVRKIADGAALMTETTVTTKVVSAVSNLLGNTPLEQAMYDNMMRLGAPEFDEADRAYAREIQKTLSDEDIAAAFRRHGLKVRARQGAVRHHRAARCQGRRRRSARPMSATCPGRCRRCRRAARPMRSARRAIPGS